MYSTLFDTLTELKHRRAEAPRGQLMWITNDSKTIEPTLATWMEADLTVYSPTI